MVESSVLNLAVMVHGLHMLPMFPGCQTLTWMMAQGEETSQKLTSLLLQQRAESVRMLSGQDFVQLLMLCLILC